MLHPGLPRSVLVAGACVMATMNAARAMPRHDGSTHYGGSGQSPFSSAVRAGGTVYLSGQIGADDHGLGKDFDAQAHLAMDSVMSEARLAGIGPDQIVKCTVMLADMGNYGAFNEIYRTYFQPGRFPARSAFGVAGLARGSALEVECVGHVAAAHQDGVREQQP